MRIAVFGLLAGLALASCQNFFVSEDDGGDSPGNGDNAGGGGLPAAEAPAFTPAGGTFDADIEVILAPVTSGTVVHYTLDGSDPTPGASGTELYDPATPIAVSGNGTSVTVKAIAVGDDHAASPVAGESYTIAYPAPPAPEAGIRHVATPADGGSDTSGNGSSAAPFATIDAAIADLSPAAGETEVRVAGGTYPYAFRSLTLEQGVLVKGGYNPANWAERDPSTWETIIDGESTRWTVSASDITETPRTGLDGVTVLADTGYTGRTINYAVYIWNSAVTIADARIQGGRSDNRGTTALYVSGTTTGIVRTTTVENSTITISSPTTPTWADAVQVYQNGGGANLTIRNSTLETGPGSISATAISINGGPGALVVENSTLVVGAGASSSTGVSASQQTGGQGHVVRGTTITMGVSPDSSGIYGYYSDDLVIEENTIIGQADDGSGASIGIVTGGGSGLRLRNNLIRRPSGGSQSFIGISARATALVDNNTIVNENADGAFTAIATDVFGPNPANPSIRNNVIASTVGNASSVGLEIAASSPATNTTPLVLQNNLFHGLATLVAFGGTAYTDPADLNEEGNTTARAAGTADANVVAVPAFAAGGFRLSAGSPAAARTGGLDLSGDAVLTDRDGTTRTSDGSGTGYSMGAYELDL